MFPALHGVVMPAVKQKISQCNDHHYRDNLYFLPARAPKIAKGPENHRGQLDIIGKILEQRRRSGKHGTERHTAEHHGFRRNPAEPGEHQDHNRSADTASKSADGDEIGIIKAHVSCAASLHTGAQDDDGKGSPEARALGNTKGRSVCQRVLEYTLKYRSGYTEAHTAQHGCHDSRQPDIPHDHIILLCRLTTNGF